MLYNPGQCTPTELYGPRGGCADPPGGSGGLDVVRGPEFETPALKD